MAINYENTNNFDNSVFSAGTNPTNSVASYFVSYANGVPLDVLENSNYGELDHGGQQAYLGYQAYIINPITTLPSNTQYNSNITAGGNYYQENSIYTTGYNGKLSFNAATSYKNKLYLGINLNSHFTDFTQNSSFYESNNNPLNTDYTVKNLRFDNNLHTYGTGFSFQIGAIAKVTNEIRLGLAYESPTWYNLSDEFSQKLTAVSANNANELPADIVDPKIINYYAPYKLQTPAKFTGSFAYIFGKTGLISLDYSMKNYGDTQFQPKNDPYYRIVNNEMSNILKTSGELRLGAEYKIKEWSLRGGYRFEESPYKNKTTIGDLNSISGGLGYNFGMFKLDFSYTNAQRNSQQGFFNQGFTDSAKINTKDNNFTMTLLFEM
jgi:long-subunit fatty acid transport protein